MQASYRPPDDHPCRQPPRGSSAQAAGANLTEMFQGAEYFLLGSGDILATSSDVKHGRFDTFIKQI